METKSAAIHRKMLMLVSQLPITGSAHKAANGRRPLPAGIGTAQSARAQRHANGSLHARPTCCRSAISMWSSRSLPRLPTSPFTTRRRFMTCCSGWPPRPWSPSPPTSVSRCTHRHHRRPPRLGLRDDAPPHIHMIVPGGGISLDGERWVSSRPAFLLPVRVLAKLFRRRFLAGLQQLHAADRLRFFGDHVGLSDRRTFLRHLAPLRKKRCRVGGDVAVPTPHRPGRADFPHPVPHERDSLAAA